MELLLQDMLIPPTLQHHVLDELLYSILFILSEVPQTIHNTDIFCEIIMSLEDREMIERMLSCLLQIVQHSDLSSESANRIFMVMQRIEYLAPIVQHWYILQLECEIVTVLTGRSLIPASSTSVLIHRACSYDEQVVSASFNSLYEVIPNTLEDVLRFLFSIVAQMVILDS